MYMHEIYPVYTDNCTLLTCYQCFLDPPSDTTHNIHIQVYFVGCIFPFHLLGCTHSFHCECLLQLLRLISNILLVSEGPKVLFESSVCSCSHEVKCVYMTCDYCLVCNIR